MLLLLLLFLTLAAAATTAAASSTTLIAYFTYTYTYLLFAFPLRSCSSPANLTVISVSAFSLSPLLMRSEKRRLGAEMAETKKNFHFFFFCLDG